MRTIDSSVFAVGDCVEARIAGLNLFKLFSLFIWNQEIGHFSSEMAQSPLFKAYLLIKNLEKKGKKRKEIMSGLTEKFGKKILKTEFIK